MPASQGGVPIALALLLHRSAQHGIQDVRLRVVSGHRAEGLIRLDLVIADRLVFGSYLLVLL